MALIVGTNSYVSMDEAAAIISEMLDTQAWNDADNIKKEKALIEATRIIDGYRYRGRKLTVDQVLEFPRLDINIPLNDAQLVKYSLMDIQVPQDIKLAQVEQAVYLLQGMDEIAQMAMKGVSSFSAGGASITFDNKEYSLLSPKAKHYLNAYLTRLGVIR